jgi:thymidylate kinase
MFVVLESVTGGGNKIQYKEVTKTLREQGEMVIAQDFPDRAGVLFENIIYPTLHEGVSNTPIQRFIAFLLDMLSHVERIEKHRNKGYVITESYFTSTIAYQVLFEKAVSLKDALKIAEIVRLPVPDLAIYIDTPYKKAHQNRIIVEGFGDKDDFWGNSVNRIKEVDRCFKSMVDNALFCPWEVVDGSLDEKEITGHILDIIKRTSRE